MKNLFLCDVDGTLIGKEPTVSPAAVRAVRDYMAAGGLFALSTGRHIPAVLPILRQLPVNAPCILCSGALTYDFPTRRAVSCQKLSLSAFRCLARQILERWPGVSVTVYTENSIASLRLTGPMRSRGIPEDRTAPLVRLEDIRGPIKLLLSSEEPEELEAIGRELVDPALFDCHAASTHFYEITSAGVCKGSAARELCALLDYGGGCRLFAAGNSASDLTLTPFCRCFFAPATAPEAVRRRADILFPDPDLGGAAEALEKARALL